MANLTETPTYEAGIYRFETTDPVQGGPGGIDNLPTNQLANRTAWLKAQVEAILLDIAAIESGYATTASLAGHTGNTSNPHGTTAAQVGLGNVQNYGIASQTEAEAGAIDTKYMTPLRAKQAIAALVPDATETDRGKVELASAAEAQAMSNASCAITPATLAAAMKGGNQSLTSSGWQKLPGGMILQWGTSASIGPGSSLTIAFPITFPNTCIAASAMPGVTASTNNPNPAGIQLFGAPASSSQFVIRNMGQTNSYQYTWIAIGY